MENRVFFRDVNNVPPCGYFYEAHGERVSGRTYLEVEPKVRMLMAKYGIPGLPEMVIASYMCPKLDDPGRYCRGPFVAEAHVTSSQAFANSVPYCSRTVVPFDRIGRREQVCLKCPKHQRHWCPTCTGHPRRLNDMMGGVRPGLPEDKMTGVCGCAKAYEYAVASVEYAKNEKIWTGAPDTCWRFHDV